MTTAALQIDLDVLDELFANQKKLDDILLFDDDFLIDSSMSLNDQSDSQDLESPYSNENLSFNSEDNMSDWKSRSKTSAIVIGEVIVMYYGFMHFT